MRLCSINPRSLPKFCSSTPSKCRCRLTWFRSCSAPTAGRELRANRTQASQHRRPQDERDRRLPPLVPSPSASSGLVQLCRDSRPAVGACRTILVDVIVPALFFRLLFTNQRLGGQNHSRDAGGVLQRSPRYLHWVDDPAGQHVGVLTA